MYVFICDIHRTFNNTKAQREMKRKPKNALYTRKKVLISVATAVLLKYFII
jgi:hypothetical protein